MICLFTNKRKHIPTTIEGQVVKLKYNIKQNLTSPFIPDNLNKNGGTQKLLTPNNNTITVNHLKKHEDNFSLNIIC